ncbi:MAG: hypothetical protein L6R37_006727 [Teloschistes peruensis]|nr:MAG: hypothetical protein L6R37_006727 [Teloschistes peruensis]
MMYSSSLTKGAYLALAVVSMFQASRANIMGCDAVDCPRDKYNETQCVIGNTTARAIGISSFTSELLSAQPLNWTVAVRPINNQQIVFERDFFLGKAVSTNTETTKPSDIQACSLFFEDVASRLQFPGVDPERDQGTCSDALTASCVDDLRKQSQDELTKMVRDQQSSSSDSGSNQTFCGRLADTLRNHAPASCAIATNGDWGTIQARTIATNSTVTLTPGIPAPALNCPPTTGGDYFLVPVEASRFNVSGQSPKKLQNLLFGVTPILTVAYDSNVTDVEVDLSCLKTIGSKAGMVTDRASAASEARLSVALGLSSIVVASFTGLL